MRRSGLILVILLACCGVADAQYVLELKNGRQITVQSYRQDGAMIRFSGLGGEMAIGSDQIRSIRRAGESERDASSPLAPARPSVPAASPPSAVSPQTAKAPETTSADSQQPMGGQPSATRVEEERAYQQQVKELTAQLRELRERYALLTRGNTGSEPKLFTTDEAFRGHQEDLLSRLRDAQYRAQGLPSGSNATSPPFSLDAPPAYSERQKELSDLRRRMSDVEGRRQKLIEEMKLKNFDTGSLFLD
jgi:hypothetical protein